MQKDELHTIKFAGIVCLVCSLSLAGVRQTLRPIQLENERMDKQVNVLKALFPDFDPDGNELSEADQIRLFTEGRILRSNRDWIQRYFEEFITEETVELPRGREGTLYRLSRDGETVSFAFPAEGKGLWSTVHSYVGLQPDLATIRGVTFFDHGETPGLGGEASKPWFQKNFKGKKLWADGEPVTLVVAKGSAPDDGSNQVDGMSGATITGNGIQRFVNTTFRQYNETVFSAMRDGETEIEGDS
ncbi:MAG: NADH:ubiquinone reductase (Na(+)-transporting) subunit C [Verrucomicrobia bacterium]|nr:NADH:ubiquinone reductase (Na(+)-transporting) subunit C [Verrucomicrobiota bacterium]MCH8510805.1 NADH:ubiquinone reductase (Na(+)-transporting) subunit C [Kiritimatiellia bacterium]